MSTNTLEARRADAKARLKALADAAESLRLAVDACELTHDILRADRHDWEYDLKKIQQIKTMIGNNINWLGAEIKSLRGIEAAMDMVIKKQAASSAITSQIEAEADEAKAEAAEAATIIAESER